MGSDYWKSKEVSKSYSEWYSEYSGCSQCACDHGCNQWIKEQAWRTGLILRIIRDKGSTSLDKVVGIPLDRINKVYFRLMEWDSDKFNRELRAGLGVCK